jgi:hypothetical protein
MAGARGDAEAVAGKAAGDMTGTASGVTSISPAQRSTIRMTSVTCRAEMISAGLPCSPGLQAQIAPEPPAPTKSGC